ncbi:hypothetical protein BGY98DRAFT_928995, partial [Russula aff. rugulosa BPL654]
ILDQCPQIVIVREDLIKEIGARINMQRTLSCTNDINMRIGDVSFTIYAHVVHTAPFRLLLGRPFQYLLLCQHEDCPDCVGMSICDPANPTFPDRGAPSGGRYLSRSA